MSMIQFVRNYEDLSTDRGYQFRFHCDKCGNGYLSSFQTSAIGTAGSLLHAAGNIFGGWAAGASNSAYDLQRVVGGRAHDSALSTAVQEGKVYFRQCTRCGSWVCPEVCWNAQANMCDRCAPKLQEEMASAQAQARADAARAQIVDSARSYNYSAGIDMSPDSSLRAPSSPWEQPVAAGLGKACTNCGVNVGNARFCPECGAAVAAGPAKCGRCGCQPATPVKFCPDCGNKMA